MTLIIEKPTGAKLNLRIRQYPAVLGEPWGGGYFAGYISHTANGNPTHALIVAPRATGATGTGYALTTPLAWKTATTATANTTSTFDGVANTAAMVAAGIAAHPAAQFCTGLSIGGFTDWYLPARFELEIAYFNLKPTADSNSTTTGANTFAVPQRPSNYTTSYPMRTGVAGFNTSAEAFINGFHWNSTEITGSNASFISFFNGDSSTNAKTNTLRVRAFRRIALP